MKKPLISVVITCYNYGEFIKSAVESVFDQTYTYTELIVINDGSTDNSHEIIEKLRLKKSFIYVNQENKGIIATRNKGMSLARGEYVMQLDADDYLDPTYIEKSVKAAQQHSAEIVYTQTRVFGRTEYVSKHPDYDLEKLKHDNFIHATALIRKDILSDVPYDQYLNDKGNEDWDLFLGLCLAGAIAVLVDEPLLNYRKHTDRKSRSDDFEGLYGEMLVRHHIWNKYNSIYPEQFWYFSSQISNLENMISLYSEYVNLKQSSEKELEDKRNTINILESRIAHLEKRDFVTIAKKIRKNISTS